jgi:hypothetical protein
MRGVDHEITQACGDGDSPSHCNLQTWLAVRQIARQEEVCCAFFAFEMHEQPDALMLTITAPDAAREVADALFDQFVTTVGQDGLPRLDSRPPPVMSVLQPFAKPLRFAVNLQAPSWHDARQNPAFSASSQYLTGVSAMIIEATGHAAGVGTATAVAASIAAAVGHASGTSSAIGKGAALRTGRKSWVDPWLKSKVVYGDGSQR